MQPYEISCENEHPLSICDPPERRLKKLSSTLCFEVVTLEVGVLHGSRMLQPWKLPATLQVPANGPLFQTTTVLETMQVENKVLPLC